MVKTEKVGFLSQVHQGVQREAQQKNRVSSDDNYEKGNSSHFQNSIDRKTKGLDLEGKVVNGNDSENESPLRRPSKRRIQNSNRSSSSTSKLSVPRRSESQRRKHREAMGYTDSNDQDTDVGANSIKNSVPPSYDSLGRSSSSSSKAQRNLDKIKRSNDGSSSSKTSSRSRRRSTSSNKISRSQSLPRSRNNKLGQTKNAEPKHNKEKSDTVKKRSSSVKPVKSRNNVSSESKSQSGDDLSAGKIKPSESAVGNENKGEPVNLRNSTSKLCKEKLVVSKSKAPTDISIATSSFPDQLNKEVQESETSNKSILNDQIKSEMNPEMLQKFREFLHQQNAEINQKTTVASSIPTNASSSSSSLSGNTNIPADIAHQLYLSYLSAYYAGATGVWPPPAPPAYIMPQQSRNPGAQFPYFQSSYNYASELNKINPQQHLNYPYLQTSFNQDQPDPSHAASQNVEMVNSTLKSPVSCPEDYSPSPAVGNQNNQSSVPVRRRYSLERACQSDSRSSQCEDDMSNSNNTAATGNSMSDVSVHSNPNRSSEVTVSSTSKGRFVYVRSRQNSCSSSKKSLIADDAHSIAPSNKSSQSSKSSSNNKASAAQQSLGEQQPGKDVKVSSHNQSASNNLCFAYSIHYQNTSKNAQNNSFSPPPLPLPPTDHPALLKNDSSMPSNDNIPLITDSNESESLHDNTTRGPETTSLEKNVISTSYTNINSYDIKVEHQNVTDSPADFESLPPPPAETPSDVDDLPISKHAAPLATVDDDQMSHVSVHSNALSTIDMVGNLPQNVLKRGVPRNDGLSDTDDSKAALTRQEVAVEKHELPAKPLVNDVAVNDQPPEPSTPAFDAQISTDYESSNNLSAVPPPTYRDSIADSATTEVEDDTIKSIKDIAHSSGAIGCAATSQSSLNGEVEKPSDKDSSLKDTNHASPEKDLTTLNKKTTIKAHENNELSADHVLEKVDNDLKEVKRAKSVKSKVKKMFSGLKKSKADISRGENFDYYSSLSKQKNKYEEGEYRKCVEVYGFNPSWTDKQVGLQLKLFRRLRLNRTGNQHALCMLPSVEEADRLLNTQFANMQVRLLTDATAKTKEKAERKLNGEKGKSTLSLASNMSRVSRATNASVANRMIMNSLGRSNKDKLSTSKHSNAK